jgi:hypothetical protein
MFTERNNLETMLEKGYYLEHKSPLFDANEKKEPKFPVAKRDFAIAMRLAEDPEAKKPVLALRTSPKAKKEENWVVKDGRMIFLEPGKTISQHLKEANLAARIAEAE